MNFLIRGIQEFDEPGVVMSFEENAQELASNVASLGFDAEGLIAAKKLVIDHVFIERALIEEAGEYDLEAIFVRLEHAIKTVGAKRVLIDTPEALFAGLTDHGVLRSEFRRLFRWLKDKGVTSVMTAEEGQGTLTRHGLEEYVSDCVVALNHQMAGDVFTRRLRIIKYRGSSHGTNGYPFLITKEGISVAPLTSVRLDALGSSERVSSGVPDLDEMLGGQGYFKGSSVLISGTSGSGKTSIAAHALHACCKRGEPALALLFEESPLQHQRNMRSIGLDLEPWMKKGLLQILATRPTTAGLETHLLAIEQMVAKHKPAVVVLDPVSSLALAGTNEEANSTVVRVLDSLKRKGITTVCTSLTDPNQSQERTDMHISSVMDTWVLLRDIETGGERNRGIYVLKSRGMKHSNQIREFLLTSEGIRLRDVYLGPAGLVTGSARVSQEALERSSLLHREQELARRRLEAEKRQRSIEAQIATLQIDLKSAQQETQQITEQADAMQKDADSGRDAMTASRQGARPNGAGRARRKDVQ